MNTQASKYDFIRNKICPYCQSKIKSDSDFIVCSHCGTPHHKECWDENGGCTTYGCVNNPHTEDKVELASEDVGNETVESIRESIREPVSKNLIDCPNCSSKISAESIYCSHCGYNLRENKNDDAKSSFEKEYKRRYKEKYSVSRKRFLITLGSFAVLITVLTVLFIMTINKLNEYFSSDEYRIRSAVFNWKQAWENEDIDKFKSYMSEDYEYFGKDGKKIDYKDRIKRIETSFRNYDKIRLEFSDFKFINDSSTTSNDRKVQFRQSYKSDKYKEDGIKTLRLFKEQDSTEWKIYREFLD